MTMTAAAAILDAPDTLLAVVAAEFPAAEHDTEALVALMDGCANPGVTRQVLLIRPQVLPAAYVRAGHLRLVAAAADPLLGQDRARLFVLDDATLVMIWRGQDLQVRRTAAAALDHLFAGLPADRPAYEQYDLPGDTPGLAACIAASVPRPAHSAAPSGPPLDPGSLARLEAALAQADVGSYGRRRPVCRWASGEVRTLAWEKRTLAVRLLAAALSGAELQPKTEPWLFRRLTRTLDRRMLVLLTDPAELRTAGPFALDLNVSSILGPDFLRFDAMLPAHLRGAVTLNLLPVDILADTPAFVFARDFARGRGYRLMLRGMTPAWLHVFPPDLLDLDLIELRASPDLLAAPPASLPDPAMLHDRTVLAGTATPQDLEWGWHHGVTLFSGPIIQTP